MMLTDFLPAIISIAILAGAFLCACVSDLSRIRRLRVHQHAQTKVEAAIEPPRIPFGSTTPNV
jgi:hypothetical protein